MGQHLSCHLNRDSSFRLEAERPQQVAGEDNVTRGQLSVRIAHAAFNAVLLSRPSYRRPL